MRKAARTSTGIVLGCLLSAGLLPPAAVAGGEDDDRVVSKSRIRIVQVDEDGDSHAETFEFDGETPRPFLGVVTTGRREDRGVLVLRVIEDSPAERAELEAGDVILRIGGDEVEDSLDLTRRILGGRPGDRLEIEVDRDGASRLLVAELGEHGHGVAPLALGDSAWALGGVGDRMKLLELPGDDRRRLHLLHGAGGDRPRLGVELVHPTPELREHFGGAADAGVIVGRVLRGMPADVAGMRVGDLIVAMDGDPIDDPGDLIELLDGAEGRTVRLELIRDGRAITLDVAIPEADDGTPAGPRA